MPLCSRIYNMVKLVDMQNLNFIRGHFQTIFIQQHCAQISRHAELELH